MYKDRTFALRPLEEVYSEINMFKASGYAPRRIFLADGNALCMPSKSLFELIHHLKETFPSCERISAYAAPADILAKGETSLLELKSAGLDLVYLGLESGSNQILSQIRKGATAQDMIEAAQSLRRANIHLSVTVISGLGGRDLSYVHAIETAKVLNQMQPQYLGLLTLILMPPSKMYTQWQSGDFHMLEGAEVLQETKLLLEHLTLQSCTFRSNHASNYFALKGNLPTEKIRLIAKLDKAIEEGSAALRSEHTRGL